MSTPARTGTSTSPSGTVQYNTVQYSSVQCSTVQYSTGYLGGGPGHVGLVLVIDHARRPVLGHEGGDVGGGVADPGVGVGQQVVLGR